MTVQKNSSLFFRYAIAWLGATILLLLLVEGLASFAYVTKLLFSPEIPIARELLLLFTRSSKLSFA